MKRLIQIAVPTLLLFMTLGVSSASAQNPWLGYPYVSSDPFDYQESVDLAYDSSWDTLFYGCGCEEWDAQSADIGIAGDDWWGDGDGGAVGQAGGWFWGPFEDNIAGEYMWPVTYYATLTVTYYNAEQENYVDYHAYSNAQVQPAFRGYCLPDVERSQLVTQYYNWSLPLPSCSDFTQSVPTQSHYSFSDWRSHDAAWSWAILREALTGNVYCIVSDYGSTPSLNSGYRTPNKQHTEDPAHMDSPHPKGTAADLQVSGNTQWNALRDIAKGGSCGAGCVEPRDATNHIHVDYRGACPTGW